MQDKSGVDGALPAETGPADAADLSRRELLGKIERFAYAAPALAILVEPLPAAGYGRGGNGGKGKGRGGKGAKDGKGGKGGRGRADIGGAGSGGASKGAGVPRTTSRGVG